MILNSPQNPTGGVLARETLAAAAGVLRDSPAWVLSDEVYGRLVHEGAFASIATEPGMLERTIVLDSFSKTYAMTGWRCGYAAVPEPLVEPLTRFLVNATSCVPRSCSAPGSPRSPARRTASSGCGPSSARGATSSSPASRPCRASPAASRTARSTRSRT